MANDKTARDVERAFTYVKMAAAALIGSPPNLCNANRKVAM